MAGKGTIQKRGKNSWRLSVNCGMDANKKQIRKTKTITVEHTCAEKSCKNCKKVSRCRARKEAEKQLALFAAEVEKGMFIAPAKLTFQDFIERWLRDYGEKNLSVKTVARYKELLTRINQAMGHLKIGQIKPAHLMEFYANLQEDGVREDGKPGGLSEQTILHHHRLLSTIFNTAVQWEIIPSNPAAKVKPPKVRKKEVSYYDEEQTAALLEALGNEPLKYKVLIHLAIATGCRRGELMGLEWQDVDFDNSTIKIRQASQYLPGKGVFAKAPKNETSVRTISVPSSVMALLKQYKAYQAGKRLKAGDLWQGSDRLFVTWDGRPIHPDTPSHWFKKFIQKHGLPPLTFHGLRHTSATLLIGQGAPLKSISARLGHSNISTTGDIYAHALKSVDRQIADSMDSLFTKEKAQK